MVNTKIRLIIFFAAKDGEALYSQQKKDHSVILNVVSSILRAVYFSCYDTNLHLSIPLSSPPVLESAKSSVPLRNALITHLANIFGTA